jgi:hypothetical protein
LPAHLALVSSSGLESCAFTHQQRWHMLPFAEGSPYTAKPRGAERMA